MILPTHFVAISLDTPAIEASPAVVPAGQFTERVVRATDPTQRNTLFLPPGYTKTRPWPGIIPIDHRGRAMGPLRPSR